MSITLAPIDDDFVPARFALIGAEEIWDYVVQRQEFRSFGVSSNELPKMGRRGNRTHHESTESSLADSHESLQDE